MKFVFDTRFNSPLRILEGNKAYNVLSNEEVAYDFHLEHTHEICELSYHKLVKNIGILQNKDGKHTFEPTLPILHEINKELAKYGI